MKRWFMAGLVVGALSLSLIGSGLAADTPGKKAAKKPAQSRYLLIVPHSQEECLKALDEFSKQGSMLSRFDFGCEAGDHTGYAYVMAASEEDALKNVPAEQRDKAKAVKMTKFTPQELKAIHQKMDKAKGTETGQAGDAGQPAAAATTAPAAGDAPAGQTAPDAATQK